MDKLCPQCMTLQENFITKIELPNSRETRWTVTRIFCERCGLEIPFRYVNEYDKYHPVEFSIFGWEGHGKTVFLTGMLLQMNQLAGQSYDSAWKDLTCEMLPVTEDIGKTYEENILKLERSEAPNRTVGVQPPVILRLSNIPTIGSAQLIVHDTPGEAFTDRLNFYRFVRHLIHSRFIILLVSFPDSNPRTELSPSSEPGYWDPGSLPQPPKENKLIVDPFNSVIREFMKGVGSIQKDGQGIDLKEISVLVAVTKGDEIAKRPSFETEHKELYDFLTMNGSPERELFHLDNLRSHVRNWLRSEQVFNNCLLLEHNFKQVDYCILSASGGPFEQSGGVKKMSTPPCPRGVLLPLFWALLKRMEIQVRTQIEEMDNLIYDAQQNLIPFLRQQTVQWNRVRTPLQKFNTAIETWNHWVEQHSLRKPVLDYQPSTEEESRLWLLGESTRKAQETRNVIRQIQPYVDLIQEVNKSAMEYANGLSNLEREILQGPFVPNNTEPDGVEEDLPAPAILSLKPLPGSHPRLAADIQDYFHILWGNLSMVRRKLQVAFDCEDPDASDYLLQSVKSNLATLKTDLKTTQEGQEALKVTPWSRILHKIGFTGVFLALSVLMLNSLPIIVT